MKSSPSSNGVEFLNQVEFSNNGALDSLTGAPAPKVFFDNLAREISKSKRKFQPISIVMAQVLLDLYLAAPIKVLVESFNTKNRNLQSKKEINQSGSAYERQLVSVGRCLKSSMRGGDFYSRIADDGFWICLQGDAVDAQKAANRFASKISEAKYLENKMQRRIGEGHSPDKDLLMVKNQRVKFAISEWDGKSNDVEWIHKIDLIYFDHWVALPK